MGFKHKLIINEIFIKNINVFIKGTYKKKYFF